MAEILTTQHGSPATCKCWLEFQPEFDEDNEIWLPNPTAVLFACEAHEGITDPVSLHATHLTEMETLVDARFLCVEYGVLILDWMVREDTGLPWMLVDLSRAFYSSTQEDIDAFKALLEATGIDVDYAEGSVDIPDPRPMGASYDAGITSPSTGRRITYGCRDDLAIEAIAQQRFGAGNSYFPVLGNSTLVLADEVSLFYDSAGEHINAVFSAIDAEQTFTNFSIRTYGNQRTTSYVCRLDYYEFDVDAEEPGSRILIEESEAVASYQRVLIPAKWDGVMICKDEDPLHTALIPANSAVWGTCIRFDLAEGAENERVGILQSNVDAHTTGTRWRNIYSNLSTGGAFDYGGNGFNYVPHMLGGSNLDWTSWAIADLSAGELAPFVDSLRWPVASATLAVRSSGIFSFLNTTQDGGFSAGANTIKMYRLPTDSFTEYETSGSFFNQALSAPAPPEDIGNAFNPLSSFHALYDEADPSDEYLIAMIKEGATEEFAPNWYRVQSCWTADVGTDSFDWMIGENWHDSRTGSDRNQEDIDPDFVALIGSDRVNRWIVSPYGCYGTCFYGQALVGNNEYVRRDVEAVWSNDISIRHLRAYCDRKYDGRTLRIGLIIDGVDSTSLLDVSDEGRIEDGDNTDEIPAGTPWCLYIEGQSGEDHVKAHFSHIAFSLGDSLSDNRQCFVRVLPEAEAVEPLPRSTRLARSVRITRADGQVFAYTEHDQDIVVEISGDSPAVATRFKACGGFSGSATELGAVTGEVGNMEIVGATSALGIKIAEVFGGMFDGATVEVFLLPWGAGNTQPVRRVSGGFLGEVKQQGIRYQMEQLSPSAYLRSKPLIETVSASCRFVPVGSPRCGVTLTPFAVTVTAVDTGDDVSKRRTFTAAARTEDAGFFAEGVITAVTGDNAGLQSKVKAFGDGEFILWEPLVYEVQVGDTFTVTAGCDGTTTSCRDKFDNFNRYGGDQFVPGLDKSMETPDPKEG